MNHLMVALAGLGLMMLPPSASAGATRGKQKAQTCVGCHGPEGRSTNDLWPSLAGQKREYLIKQLRAFKTGERKDPMMNPLAATLTDQDISDLADYYSSP